MAASASLTIPVLLAGPTQRQDAFDILSRTPGASDVTVDAASGNATLAYQFPGNIDAVMRRLVKLGLTDARSATVSIPVKNLSGRVIDPTQLIHHLNESPAVSGASFDGATVSATIVPLTATMRYLYEEIVIAGLTAIDVPTVARPLDFAT